MSTHCTANLNSISNAKNFCVICHNSNLKEASPSPENSSDPDKSSDQLLRIFYQCINVQPPIKFDRTTPPEFCTNCKEYLEESDNIAMQVALLITRAKRIENTLTSRVLLAPKSSPQTLNSDDQFFRSHLEKKFNPVIRLEQIQPEASNEVEIEPENLQPLTSKVSRISSEKESDEWQENRPRRRSKRPRKKSKRNWLKNKAKRKSDLSHVGYPNFDCDFVKQVGPGEYKFKDRIPFTFKDGVFSCGCCFRNYEGHVDQAKSRMLAHVTKYHSDDLPDWLERAGLDASEIQCLQLGMYIFRSVVPFSVRKNPSTQSVSFKCERCPRAVSGPLRHCWSEFSRHMTLTHMGDPLVENPEPNEGSFGQDSGQDQVSSCHNVMEKVPKEEQQEDEDDFFVPEINIEEFGPASQLDGDPFTSSDLASILAGGQDRFLCQLCNVIFLNQTDLETHIDLVHTDVFKSEIEPGFEPMITQDLFNEDESIDDDMKMDPLEIIGP